MGVLTLLDRITFFSNHPLQAKPGWHCSWLVLLIALGFYEALGNYCVLRAQGAKSGEMIYGSPPWARINQELSHKQTFPILLTS